MGAHTYNGPYTGEYLDRIAFPLGGIGAGMICLDGTGGLSHTSLRHRPDVHARPGLFAAVCVKGAANRARVLEGPVPGWKITHPWSRGPGAGDGGRHTQFGLPRFGRASFEARFPFATVALADDAMPVDATVTGWSPFTPPDANASSWPVAAVEYTLTNPTDADLDVVFSVHARNIMADTAGAEQRVERADGGVILRQGPLPDTPHAEGALSLTTDDPAVRVDPAWFRGGWFDPLTMLWRTVARGEAPDRPPHADGPPSAGGSLYVPMTLAAGDARTVRVRLAWYVPASGVSWAPRDEAPAEACCRPAGDGPTYRPWYAERFDSIEAVTAAWADRYDALRQRSARFRDCFYDTTLPAEVVEAVAANLTILTSPTVLRQDDGRLWCWEGCCDGSGCCAGSCTHVWNYAQALPHLFPSLERSLRATEFNENQDDRGHQGFRAALPIRTLTGHTFHAAADGQLGGIMKVFRDWRISGDLDWLDRLWPKVKASLDYCVATWDPDRTGLLIEPHHNTYDIEFWGPDGMCSSIYLGALTAAAMMAEALGEDAGDYAELRDRSRRAMEAELFDGDYFIQRIRWTHLRAGDPTQTDALPTSYTPEARELLQTEGPKYQYGAGCLSDGILGAWLAAVCGVGDILDPAKVARHLQAVFAHNFRESLADHANPQRPTYALGDEAGLLLCTWPEGGALSLPFVYSNEVWTGIEYQVASHLMRVGAVDEGLRIVRAARDRYDGRVRNPFDEYECGHWYARAMASYALLEGLTGIRFDAVTKVLTIAPGIGGDVRSFLATATGYGTAGVRDGEPFVDVVSGTIDIERIEYVPRV
ncbi:MAG: GH116 family glycosyl hydrolase [Planctomycetota bacterium]